MNYFRQKKKGFTLLELLLVLVIISAIMLAFINFTTQKSDEMRRDKTVLQMQQILNAGLAYYINNSVWPENLTDLYNGNYIPTATMQSPWATPYVVGNTDTSTYVPPTALGNLTVCTVITGNAAPTIARILAGRLPLAVITSATSSDPNAACASALSQLSDDTCTGNSCAVVAMVTIPGQNLNNARSVNFTGIYHNGACVPAPICPGNMKPSIMVVPAGVSGIYDPASTPGGNPKIHPLTTFTAYALPKSGDPVELGTKTNSTYIISDTCNLPQPPPTDLKCYDSVAGNKMVVPGKYWRVCLDYQTDLGPPLSDSSATSSSVTWASSSYIVAITRCVPNNEPSGSSLDVAYPFPK